LVSGYYKFFWFRNQWVFFFVLAYPLLGNPLLPAPVEVVDNSVARRPLCRREHTVVLELIPKRGFLQATRIRGKPEYRTEPSYGVFTGLQGLEHPEDEIQLFSTVYVQHKNHWFCSSFTFNLYIRVFKVYSMKILFLYITGHDTRGMGEKHTEITI